MSNSKRLQLVLASLNLAQLIPCLFLIVFDTSVSAVSTITLMKQNILAMAKARHEKTDKQFILLGEIPRAESHNFEHL